ncbi:MAG: PD-(D/E)XK nuclease family protein [Acidobacteria bacterium]|nr:PD-(D/E)XK nuclease family protein [Acidobacteriota bacterium]
MSYTSVIHDAEVLRIRDLQLAEECAASWPSPGPTSARGGDTAPPLVRWLAVRDAIEAWHTAADPDAAVAGALGHLDPVQREICGGLIEAYQRAARRDDPISFDVDPIEVSDRTDRFVLRSWPTAVLSSPGEPAEVVKLRTGGDGTGVDEAAVLVTGGPEGASFVDLMLSHDDQVQIELTDEERHAALSRLFGTARRVTELRPSQRVVTPGRACYMGCVRPAYCGAYPPATDRTPGSRARLVVVSKTALATLARCERRAAWKHFYSIPPDSTDIEDTGPGVGLHVHDILAAILLEEHPKPLVDELLANVPPSEVADVRFCIDNHLAIDDEHDGPLTYRRPNLQAGLTFVIDDGAAPGAPGKTEQVAAVVICEIDAVGREADGTAAIVEHKTSDRPLPHEQDLYAVAGWQHLTAAGYPPDIIAVHHHFLARSDSPRCERAAFGPEDISAATARLQAVVERVARWDPLNAARPDPKASFDSYCAHCPFQARCARHDGPLPPTTPLPR